MFQISVPPNPRNPDEAARWDHTRKRFEILSGGFDGQLDQWMVAQFGIQRTDAMGRPDKSANFLAAVTRALSVLYVERPWVAHAEGALPDLLGEDVKIGDRMVRRPGAIERSGVWSLMQRVQQWTIALNECLVHLDYHPTIGLVATPVTPDYVVAIPLEGAPNQIGRIAWLRARRDPETGAQLWCWDVWDVRDPAAPSYRVFRDEGGAEGQDVTAWAMGGNFSGDAYPWRYEDRSPFVPWVLYHRELGPCLFDPFENQEAVDGTLTLCCLWSFWTHVIRAASWPQRYIAGGEIAGAGSTSEGGGYQYIPTDPSSVLQIHIQDNAGQALIGQWQPSGDPRALGEAIAAYEARLAQQLGVSPGDLVRESGDPRSGYALAVSADAKNESRRRFAPVFRPSDERLVALCAVILNRATGTSYPESGYAIDYALPDGSSAGASGEKAQDTALNGAQVAAAQAIVQSAVDGTIPLETAAAMLVEFFRLSEAAVAAMIDPIKTFEKEDEPQKPAPVMGQAPDEAPTVNELDETETGDETTPEED